MRSPYGRQRCRRLEMRAITATLTLKPLMDQTRGVLFPSHLPTFQRFAPPPSTAELAQWFWIYRAQAALDEAKATPENLMMTQTGSRWG